jgi:sugar phosphate isomerase/epimerase
MEIISASRRCDIPAFHADWFVNRLHAGWAEYRNPFGPGVHRVSLAPDDVRAIVFWTRNPAPLVPHLDELDRLGYKYYFHFTITGLPPELDPWSPPKDAAVQELRRLSQRLGTKRVLWRFDPLLASDVSPLVEQQRWFEILAGELAGLTERCYISFATFYAKAARRLGEAGVEWRDPGVGEKIEFAGELSEIAQRHGIAIYACCSQEIVGGSIQRAHCVDAELIEELWPLGRAIPPIRPTRRGCGCHASRDIGAYDTCGHGCLYCYASTARSSPECDPEAPRLSRGGP